MSLMDVGRKSIQHRLRRGFFATTGLALLLTSSALFFTAAIQFQSQSESELELLAGVIGANLEASLLFDDDQTAIETLRALKAANSIEAAVVYDDEGKVFARYVRADIRRFEAPSALVFEPRWSRETIDLASKITLGDEQIGAIFIRSDTRAVTSFLYDSVSIVVAVLVISFFMCWMGSSWLRRQIAEPLDLLVAGSASMAAGDLSTQVEVHTEDEIGVLAHAFNAMVKSLSGLVARVDENTRYVAEASGQLALASSSVLEEASRQEQAVEDTAESIEHIMASMHTVNASVEALSETAIETSSAAIEMDSSIVETGVHIDALSEIIDTTASSVVEMTSAIREIARSADTLNQSTESTSSALDLLSGSVRQVETNARESHALSNETSQRAEEGMAAVHQTVNGINEIQNSFKGIESIISNLSEKSESIGAVVKVIESVVEQTNLLALNAAIISSQAGEHGRAFSVVAEEVRSLAERTAASTREIAELIEAVQGGVGSAVQAMQEGATRVERGVSLSNEAGRILREIGDSSQQSTKWAREIVEATRSQAGDIGRVSIAMEQVKDISTQLNRGTHEQDSASSEITRGVEQMRHLGLEVKNSAQEQRKESRLITQSVEVVASKIKQISVETKAQSKRADQIAEALKVFREVTLESSRRAEQTTGTVSDLAAYAKGLQEEIGRFRL